MSSRQVGCGHLYWGSRVVVWCGAATATINRSRALRLGGSAARERVVFLTVSCVEPRASTPFMSCT